AYFRDALGGQRLAMGEVLLGRAIGKWVITIARPIRDQNGRLQAVLAVGTLLEHFQDALRVRQLPAGSVVRIISEHGVVIAQSDDPSWIGRDLTRYPGTARHLPTEGLNATAVWPDNIERITASATTHLAPWTVSVGLPK